ncbi:hypothetical protein GCM10020254_51250 [Streptomyces goshikiensis]
MCALALLPAAPASAAQATAADADKPAVALSLQEAAKGAELGVTGTGWPAKTLVMLLVCGQNMIGGTNSCANSDGVAVAVAADGRFTARLPVVAPPNPCPLPRERHLRERGPVHGRRPLQDHRPSGGRAARGERHGPPRPAHRRPAPGR